MVAEALTAGFRGLQGVLGALGYHLALVLRPARLTIHRCQGTRLRSLFCYAERGSVFRNGNWAFTGA
jgi:hypothetical protein